MQVPGYILKHSSIKDEKTWHFYLLIALWASAYTTMNISIVLFLQESLHSIFLAGLALSIGSCFALVFDSIFNAVQKRFSARNLFLYSVIGMMFSVSLFFIPGSVIFAYIAAIFFRISFDLCDITALSYIFSHSLPAEYGERLSYKQFSQGIGMLVGFILSALLMKTSSLIGVAVDTTTDLIAISPFFNTSLFIMKILILSIILLLFFLAYILFDKNVEVLDKTTLKTSWQKLQADTIEELKNAPTVVMKNIQGIIPQEKNQVHIINTNETKTPFSLKDMFKESFESLTNLVQVYKKRPRNIPLIWALGTTGIFSYWDTFLITFLPIYFTEVLRNQEGWLSGLPGSVLLLFFILPILLLLPIIAKLADKYGRPLFTITGLIFTIVSTLSLGILGSKGSLMLIIVSGYGISLGYLFGMSSAKAEAASKLNEFFAVENEKSEIDSNISAGPLMLIDNIGNIIGPTLGGFLLSIAGFSGYYIVFSIGLFTLLLWSIRHYQDIKTPNYIFNS